MESCVAGWVAVGSGGEDFVKLGGDEAGVVPGVWGAFQQLVGEGGEAVQGESAAGVLESGLISGGEAAEESCMPAMWWGGRGRSQAPGPPSTWCVAVAEARSWGAPSWAYFGSPVVPEVATTRVVSAARWGR